MIKRISTFILLTCFLAGCKEATITQNPSLSNNEILQLMDAEVFEVQIPDDIQPDQFAGFATKYSDGTIKPMSSRNGWTPGEVVKLVCFAPKKNIFKHAFFSQSGNGQGLTTKFPITNDYSVGTKRTDLSVGEQLIRYSTDNSITLSEQPEGDDFDLIFHVHKTQK